MNLQIHEHVKGAVVTLSRRNLEALLAKLDGHPANSACELVKDFGNKWRLIVRAEENGPHYGDTPAGRMHPDTEVRITAPSEGTVASWDFLDGGGRGPA